jgi:4-amino-4-deoxy-L-arabinose transferase-like glycosyltransferase
MRNTGQMDRTSPLRRYANLIAVGILILGLAFYSYRIDEWFMHDDEGGYCYAAWRIAEGEVPYRDFLTPQLPLFLYWGGLVVSAFGPSILALRYATVLATLLAAGLVYLAVKETLGRRVALLSLPLFLLHKDVYFIARFFRPEAYMLLFTTAATYVFLASYPRRRRWGILLAGGLFGLAMLCKLFGALPAAGCGLFLLYMWFRTRDSGRVGDIVALSAGFAATAGTVFVVFQSLEPYFLTAVLGHHAMQGAELTPLQVVLNGLQFYWGYVRGNAVFLVLTFVGIARSLRGQPEARSYPVWQIPTAAAFLILSRDLQDRHLVYLVPVLAPLAALALEPLFRLRPISMYFLPASHWQEKRGAGRWAPLLLGLAAACLALWPSLCRDLDVASWDEDDTGTLAAYIQSVTQDDDIVLCDYPGLNFYAQRRNTYLGAGLSGGATSSGQISGEALIGEIENKNVRMVLINTSGAAHQLVALHDYADFRRYVQSHFHFVRRFTRSYQTFEIYHRDELMPLLAEAVFGGNLSLTGFDPGTKTAQAGGALPVTLRWQALGRMQRDYTVSLRLTDEEGHLYGQEDKLLEKTFTAGWENDREIIHTAATSEWASAEQVIDEYLVRVFPGTPPGKYALAMVLYHLGSGEILRVLDENGTAVGVEYVLGTVEVARTEKPPALDELAIHRSLTQDLGGELRLLGHGPIVEQARPGDSLRLVLFWQALRLMDNDWRLQLRVQSTDGSILAQGEFDPASSVHPTSRWAQEEVVMGQYDLTLDPAAPSGDVQLTLNLVDTATGQRLVGQDFVLAGLTIEGWRREFTVPEAIQNPLTANLANRVMLLGYDLTPTSITPGAVLHLTLYWQALESMKTSYTVFSHLLGKEGRIWGQKDSVPVQGTYPTTGWLPGEVVVDEYEIQAQPEAPLGDYVPEIGMYDSATGERLPVLDAEGRTVDDRVLLCPVRVSK